MAYAIPRVAEQLAARVFAGHKSEVIAESLALYRAAVDARLDPDARFELEAAVAPVRDLIRSSR